MQHLTTCVKIGSGRTRDAPAQHFSVNHILLCLSLDDNTLFAPNQSLLQQEWQILSFPISTKTPKGADGSHNLKLNETLVIDLGRLVPRLPT